MIDGAASPTADPLGLGGLLSDACRVGAARRSAARSRGDGLLERCSPRRSHGLAPLRAERRAARSRRARLASASSASRSGSRRARSELAAWPRFEALRGCAPLRSRASSRSGSTPRTGARGPGREHRDINEVMLATSLVPDGFLALTARRDRSRAGRRSGRLLEARAARRRGSRRTRCTRRTGAAGSRRSSGSRARCRAGRRRRSRARGAARASSSRTARARGLAQVQHERAGRPTRGTGARSCPACAGRTRMRCIGSSQSDAAATVPWSVPKPTM